MNSTIQPVWPGYFADPFVLRTGRAYYAYGTAERLERTADGQYGAFRILRSTNLAHWEPVGHALDLSGAAADHAYWAPEVAEVDGRFFLYYSKAPPGQDEQHRLHMAEADRPEGPFRERGTVLPEELGFCIDAHPFRDARDGRWYLFFARDYFDERVGTGLAVVGLDESMCAPDGEPRTVLRANHDWQIYERDRALYGRTWPAWHTVEGPCVWAHGGRYFCFYSGGNWRTKDYGVGYAVADHPLGPWAHADNVGPSVLRQIPDHLIGPGHNSMTIAPDGGLRIVFHAWDASHTARRMFIRPLEWTSGGPKAVL
jgi:beta-xylosidase